MRVLEKPPRGARNGISTLTITTVGCLLGAVALAACYVPARRATRIGPAVALRSE